ncbi:MAG: rubrerythrin family protein [Actinomycetia bacterium]|nr:rubrerythrin family protein [Actinomycetes bacterium]
MSTKENLESAFAGESQANRKYTAFARQADKDGYAGVAKLFRAAAAAETVHALNHLRVLGEIRTTDENLKAAIEGETFEHTSMYPGFIDEAQSEDNKQAVRSFTIANEVEKIHADLYKKALADKESTGADYYVCEICGNTVENEAPDVCPICGAPKTQFTLID